MENYKFIEAIGNNLLQNKTLDQSISLDDIQKLYSHGYHHFETGSYEKALSIFEKVVALSPFYKEAVYALGMCKYKLEQTPAALRCFEIFSLLDSNSPLGFLYQGYCLISINDYSRAKNNLQKAISLMKEDHPQFLLATITLKRIQ